MAEAFERAKECIRFVDEIEESLNKADVPTDRQAPCGLLPASTPERVDILIEQRDELLEALEEAKANVERVTDGGRTAVPDLQAWLRRARAALAKARGKGDAVEANR